jgi:2'-5' RNA ligase
MAEERLKRPRVRLFVALDLPAAVREGIAAWGGRELRDPALRPVAAENLHVTLAFLGHRDEAQIEPIAAAVAAGAAAAPRMELGEPEARPGRGRPRVFALPVRSEGAEALHAGLVERLGRAGLYEAEKRRFWPHVTVARVRTEGRRPMAVSKRPGALPGGLRKHFFGVRVALYRSELQPRGARYVPLAHVELSTSGRQ